MPRLPPVPISPQARLRARLVPGVICSVVDLVPIAFELLGDELREAGERALTHLRARDADHAGVVGLDGDPHIDFAAVAGGACAIAAPKPNGRLKPERESAACGGGTDDELAA